MATLKDISRSLNLSVTQVSRALNGHSDVNEETRKRVLFAAKSLKYQPNLTARKLVSGRSGMVGFVLTQYPSLASDGLVLETVAGLSSQFSRRGMQFVLHIAQEGDDVVEIYQRLIDAGSLDGFVLTEPTRDDLRIRYLSERGVPFVVHGRSDATADYPYFDIDNYGLAHRSTRYLIEHGHRRIALINGPEQTTFALDRLAGYRNALVESDLPFMPSLVRHGRMNDSLGMISAVQFLVAETPRPTAILCGNTLISKGVFKAIHALGMSVPDDVSVIAHDDGLPDLAFPVYGPELTVTRSALRDSWSPLVDFLSEAIDGKPVSQLQKVVDVEFIERASVHQAKL